MPCVPRPAIVLSSGGLDSTTCLAIARDQRFAPLFSLSFDYGQRHRHELDAARRVAEAFRVAKHRVVTIDLRQFGKSALTDDALAVPKDRAEDSMAGDVPITYVPARNTIFLSYALAWAEVLGVRDVFVGVNAVDYSGYPDCRPQFVAAFEAMANLATRMTAGEGSAVRLQGSGKAAGPSTTSFLNPEPRTPSPFKIHTPLMHLTKAQIIRRGVDLRVDYSVTHSCYDPDDAGRACGRCDSCLLRRKGFSEAGVPDPTRYVG